jgi:hypothetical protein
MRKLEEKEAALKVKIAGVKDQVFKLARYRELYPAQSLQMRRICRRTLQNSSGHWMPSWKGLKRKKATDSDKRRIKGSDKKFSKNDQRLSITPMTWWFP